MENILKEIAEKCVPQKILLEEVLKIPLFHASVAIQIHNNKIYTSLPLTEERNIQIVRQLVETTKYHQLPNVIFIYNTMDQYSYPSASHPIFTHSKISCSKDCRHILAPCASFDYLNKKNSKMYHEEQRLDIISKAESFMVTKDVWSKKENKVTFVGNLYKDRIINTRFPYIDGVEPNIICVRQDQTYYTDMSELPKYKYLLNLNGCGGGWSVRLKYLFMCGSLVFYIINYNAVERHINSLLHLKYMNPYIARRNNGYPIYNLYNIEYWMCHSDIENSIILATDVHDCARKLEYYASHEDEAFEKARRAYEYTKNVLTKENVMLYWKILLDTYRSRLDKQIDNLIFTNEFIYE
jgi:hypothetical protein